MKLYPFEKRGLSNATGGGGQIKFWGIFNTKAGTFSHTEEGRNFYPVLGGGGVRKKFQTRDFSFVTPHPSVINDRFLKVQKLLSHNGSHSR